MSITQVHAFAMNQYTVLVGEVTQYWIDARFPSSGIADGDIAYVVIFSEGGSGTTNPSGWTAVGKSTIGNFAPPGGSNPYQIEIWKRTCTSGDNSASYGWQLTTTGAMLGMAVVRGSDGSVSYYGGNSILYAGDGLEHWSFSYTRVSTLHLGFFWNPIGGTMTYVSGATPNSYGFTRSGTGLPAPNSGYDGVTSDATATYPDYAFPTMLLTLNPIVTASGSSSGTSTATAVGVSTKAATGSAAGTTPIVKAFAGVFGTVAGTSNAAAVGAYIMAAVGSAAGTSAVASLTGLRQAVGFAAGTSSTHPPESQVLGNARKVPYDGVAAGINRLAEQFRSKQTF